MTRSTDVDTCNDRARRGVADALERHGRTWYWLGCEVQRRRLGSASTVHQWRAGHIRAIGCGLYLAIVDLLAAEAR
jgi:hypothetical protein